MGDTVIVDAVRSPMGRGKPGGALSGVHPVELLADVLTALVDRTGIDPGAVDDVLIGCVGQNLEQSATPGRQAWLAAGYPEHVPSVTIERKCGSGQQAIEFAHWGLAAGAFELAVAGGVESMSRVPMGSARGDADPFGPRVRARYPGLVPQGLAAELVASSFGLSRRQLDDFSAQSHHRASSGDFSAEITPVAGVAADETIRPGTTAGKLADLRVSFGTMITAGNSSQLTDGAAALLLTTASNAAALGLRPRARIVASAVCGDDPVMMLTGVIPATRKVLDRARLSLEDIDAVEVNEAFAPVPLAWLAEFDYDPARLNPRGGAIALGHPLGASGARIMTSLIHHLEQTGGRYGLQTMCEAGGMANATIIEILEGA